MAGNDLVGDCTAAAVAHALTTWRSYAPPYSDMPDAAVLALYSAVSGYVPGQPETDRGALCLDVLDYWRKAPIDGAPLADFCALDPHNHRHVRQALWLFGCLYAGVTLTAAQETQAVWDTGGDASTWGGHCILIVAADDDGLTCITWGKRQRMTWRWWDAACDEAYGLVSPVWRSPLGVTVDAMLAAEAGVRA